MNSIPTVFDRNPTLSKPGGHAAWAESLAPLLDGLRATLRQSTPHDLADRAGVLWQEETSRFLIQHLDRRYCLPWPELEGCEFPDGQPYGAELQALILYYMERATGALPQERWVTFRELPDGGFYHRAFQGYTGDRLAVAFDDDLDRLRRAALSIGGQPMDVGDASFRFLGLPRIPLALVYWLGDDNFPPDAQVLFDAVAEAYLPIDGSAALGRRLVQRILDADEDIEETALDRDDAKPE